MSEKLPSRCPNCGGTNLQTEPLYDEEGPTEELALFCVSCGRYMGDLPSQLKGSMRDFRGSLSHFRAYHAEEGEVEIHAKAVREFLLGRRAATPDFD